ncbi:hypothetical protein JNUCC1_00980 [Lentibacillus sp. JNUCC-1]|uniref:ATP-grasp fold amidoligase family protein n=1 Tax=Lentibacillus sp. JNUCC-1 TaxID=2654513 RepID=UPI0012E73F15|nr:ATP-grasp fold amidoligase family protein [Lentibacillus sp. JNUCC-1]MUV37174.1 hypothetical protein [Lentibacillus sp. JNUCC-1]
MNYKKLIPNQEIRFKILGLLDFLPDKFMIKIQYWIKTGRILNLENPKRFTEKLQWYKLYYRDPLMTQCADKHNVRQFIIEKGYENILIPQYGVYDNANDIDFDNLPSEFVLKTTNASKTNILCHDKSTLNIEETINTLNQWLVDRPVKMGREWAYYDIKPKIICEKLIKDKTNNKKELSDYKFICFNGEAKYVWIDIDRYSNHKRNFYDLEWNFLDVDSDIPNCGDIIPKPGGLERMIQVATDLSKDFPHVRVDLYWVNEEVYFGELTFYLLSGYEEFKPDQFDFILGEQFKVDKMKY